MRKIASYEEIRRYWDLYEVLAANEQLDMMDDARWLADEAARIAAKQR